MNQGYILQEYESSMYERLVEFLESCFLETGRVLDIEGKHKIFQDIEHNFREFWCLIDNGTIIGTGAIKTLNEVDCELKTLFVYERYHGKALGYQLLSYVIVRAKACHYQYMYLDCLSDNEKALHLYERAGFQYTERYNDNANNVVFMKMKLK